MVGLMDDHMHGSMHWGRSWTSTNLEDECPCDKAPCGLVVSGSWHPDCREHNPWMAKSSRQGHRASDCPGGKQ